MAALLMTKRLVVATVLVVLYAIIALWRPVETHHEVTCEDTVGPGQVCVKIAFLGGRLSGIGNHTRHPQDARPRATTPTLREVDFYQG